MVIKSYERYKIYSCVKYEHVLSLKSFTNTRVVTMKRHANMLATCRLNYTYMNHPQCSVFYLQMQPRSVSLSSQAGGSSASPGEAVQDVAAARLVLVPGFSCLHGVCAVRWKLTHFTSLQQQQQQHMLRKTHALLASFVNHLLSTAQRADLQTSWLKVPSVRLQQDVEQANS